MNVLWALEPFHQSPEATKAVYQTLKLFADSPDSIDVGFIFTRFESTQALTHKVLEARNRTNELLKQARIKIDQDQIHVVDFQTNSTTQAVKRLLGLAKTNRSNAIALFSRGLPKKGFKHLTGSFSEALIHHSNIDVLVHSPQSTAPSKIKRILFALDFSSFSQWQLSRVQEYCKRFSAKLYVFHHADFSYDFQGLMHDERASVLNYRKEVGRIEKKVRDYFIKHNIKHEVHIVTSIKSTTEILLEYSEQTNADLVIVAAKRGPIRALIGGSTTRQVVRGSRTPVLVIK